MTRATPEFVVSQAVRGEAAVVVDNKFTTYTTKQLVVDGKYVVL